MRLLSNTVALALAGLIGLSALHALELLPVPEPPLENAEPGLRRQVHQARTAVEELHAADVDRPALAEAYANWGRILLTCNLPAPASAALENAVRLQSNQADTWYYLGWAQQRLAQLELSAASFERFLFLEPDDRDGLLRLAKSRLDSGRSAEAADLFVAAARIDPESAYARWGQGMAAMAEERWSEAAQHLRAARRLDPDATAVHRPLGMALRELGETQEARAELALAGDRMVSFPDRRLDALYQQDTGAYLSRAVSARMAGQLEEAESLYRQALEGQPKKAEIHRSLADVLFARGRVDEAIRVALRSVELKPEDAANHQKLADLLSAGGQPQAALAAYAKALELVQNDSALWLGQARALAMLQKHQEALESYDRAIELQPSEASSLALRARSLARLGRLVDAERDLRSALEISPDNLAIQLDFVELLVTSGQTVLAEDRLRSILASEALPQQARLRATLTLAKIRHGSGQLPGAIELYSRVLEEDEQRGDAHFGLGLAQAQAGKIDEAEPHLRRSVELRPRDPEARLAWAQALRAQENFEGEKEALENGLLGTRDPRIPHELARLLAACPDTRLRDPERALQLAKRAMETEQTLEFATTLALALAETGRLQQAVALQQKIIADAIQLGVASEHIDSFRMALASYQDRLANSEEPR